MDLNQLQRDFQYRDKHVIEYIWRVVCAGNYDIARETIIGLTQQQILEIKRNLGIKEELSMHQKETLKNFQAITGVNEKVAQEYLEKNTWILQTAMNSFFESGQKFETNFESIVPEKEPTKETPKKFETKLPGCYDLTNKLSMKMSDMKYSIRIVDFCATTLLTQKYQNLSENPVEMVYQFPVDSETATISLCEITFFDPKTNKREVVRAVTHGLEKAREKYDDILSSGNTAGLVEKNEKSDNLVKLNLGNVSSGVELTVNITSVQTLQIDIIDDEDEDDENEEGVAGRMCVRMDIPALLNLVEEEDTIVSEENVSGKAAKNCSVECEVEMSSGKILNVFSKTHMEFLVAKTTNSGVVVAQTKEKFAHVKTFTIAVLVENYPFSICRVEKLRFPENVKDDQKGLYKYIAMVAIAPQNKLDVSSLKYAVEHILLLDCSGSMAGSRMKAAKESAKLFLQSLDVTEKVKFNIIRFGSTSQSLYTSPKDLSPSTYDDAWMYINNTTSNLKQTDIYSPIKRCLDVPITSGYTRNIWLVTDGEDSNTFAILECAKKHASTTRVFTIGIGKEINDYLIRTVAKSTFGKSVFIQNSSEIKVKVMELLIYASSPAIHYVFVNFPREFGKVRKAIEDIPPVFCNTVHYQYFFIEKFEPDLNIDVSYVVGVDKKDENSKCKAVYVGDESRDYGTLAAAKRVYELTNFGKKKKENSAEIRTLGLSYNLLTSETSYVVKPTKTSTITTEAMKVTQIPNIEYVDIDAKIRLQRRHYNPRRQIPVYPHGDIRRQLFQNGQFLDPVAHGRAVMMHHSHPISTFPNYLIGDAMGGMMANTRYSRAGAQGWKRRLHSQRHLQGMRGDGDARSFSEKYPSYGAGGKKRKRRSDEFPEVHDSYLYHDKDLDHPYDADDDDDYEGLPALEAVDDAERGRRDIEGLHDEPPVKEFDRRSFQREERQNEGQVDRYLRGFGFDKKDEIVDIGKRDGGKRKKKKKIKRFNVVHDDDDDDLYNNESDGEDECPELVPGPSDLEKISRLSDLTSEEEDEGEDDAEMEIPEKDDNPKKKETSLELEPRVNKAFNNLVKVAEEYDKMNEEVKRRSQVNVDDPVQYLDLTVQTNPRRVYSKDFEINRSTDPRFRQTIVNNLDLNDNTTEEEEEEGEEENDQFFYPTSALKNKIARDRRGKERKIVPVKSAKSPPLSMEKRAMKIEGKLEKILYTQSIDGTWEMCEAAASFIELALEKIKDCNPNKTEMETEWMTALIVVFVRKEFADRKIEWKLIIDKAQKSLKRKKCLGLLKRAREILK